MSHFRDCPAYSNYQPPYLDCDCFCPYCNKAMEDTEHTVEYVKEQCIIGCPEHPKGNTMTAIDIASFKRKEE